MRSSRCRSTWASLLVLVCVQACGDTKRNPLQPIDSGLPSGDSGVTFVDAGPVLEICDSLDNDGDGRIDEGVTANACGDCLPECREEALGEGGQPFPDGDERANVRLTASSLSLGVPNADPPHVIWIPSSGDGTILLVDTDTFEVLGRYATSPRTPAGGPKYTVVDDRGIVYVTSPGASYITAISPAGSGCGDRNGDGHRTSHGPADLLPWGEDDCVLWGTEIPDSRISGVTLVREPAPNGDVLRLWTASIVNERLYKLDPETGEVLMSTTFPQLRGGGHGLASDSRGWIYIGIGTGNIMGRLDASRCITEEACGTEICPPDRDPRECIKQRIELLTLAAPIIVGPDDMLYTSYGPSRFDPLAPYGAQVRDFGLEVARAIAVDRRGNIFASADPFFETRFIHRIRIDEPSLRTSLMETGRLRPVGMSVDVTGKIWVVNAVGQNVTVIDPGEDVESNIVHEGLVPWLVDPDAFSQMTPPFHRRIVGRYAHVFEACPSALEVIDPQWINLHWAGEIEFRASMRVRVRTAARRESLAFTRWLDAGMVPSDGTTIALASLFRENGVRPGPFLEVELSFESTEAARAEINSLRVAYRAICNELE